MTSPIEEIAAPCEDVQKYSPIFIIAENIFSLISTGSDVIIGTGKFYT